MNTKLKEVDRRSAAPPSTLSSLFCAVCEPSMNPLAQHSAVFQIETILGRVLVCVSCNWILKKVSVNMLAYEKKDVSLYFAFLLKL